MGADLYFKVPKEQARDFNDFVDTLPEQKKLTHPKVCMRVYVYDERDLEWAKSPECPSPEYFIKYFTDKKGEGVWKASGFDETDVKLIGCNNEMEVFELVTRIFEKAIKNGFDVKIYSGSCALGGDYFTPKQICRMTEGGKRLSKHPKEKYEEIINRMKSILKERGELLKMAREYINRVSVKELEQDLIECGLYEIEPSPCQIHKF
jgi:hypothetical protein